jgi:hypothetical protein
MRNDGYKLARRFMKAKDIFRVVKNLLEVGYTCEVVDTDKDDPNFNFGYLKNILVKYVGKDNNSILPLYVFYKDKQQEHNNDFKQEVQVRYYY